MNNKKYEFFLNSSANIKKLIYNLNDKKNYVCHIIKYNNFYKKVVFKKINLIFKTNCI